MQNVSRKSGTALSTTTFWLTASVAALLSAAVIVKRKARAAELANPPRGKFLEIDGVNLHYLDEGRGEPIVLLHGNGSMAHDFALSGVVDVLARHYRVIVFDRPGYGHSNRPRQHSWDPTAQADLLHQALSQLGVERPLVVGHSWGTMVATALAIGHPRSLRGLVLLSGYYYPTARLDVPLLSLPALPVLGTLLRYTLSPLISRLLWPMIRLQLFRPSKVTDNFYRWPVWMTLRQAQLRASAAETAMMIPAAWRLSQQYEQLSMPVTVLAGDGDRIVSTNAQSVRLQRELQHARLTIVPGAGHMVHHIAPQAVIAAIDAAMQVENRELDIHQGPAELAPSGLSAR